MKEKVQEIILMVLNNANRQAPSKIEATSNLRSDIGFDSMMLAELTVHIEEEFGVDIFEHGVVTTVGEIHQILNDRKDG